MDFGFPCGVQEDTPDIPLESQDGKPGRTCPPAMGTSFAAGTTDGPSNVDDFGQSHVIVMVRRVYWFGIPRLPDCLTWARHFQKVIGRRKDKFECPTSKGPGLVSL